MGRNILVQLCIDQKNFHNVSQHTFYGSPTMACLVNAIKFAVLSVASYLHSASRASSPNDHEQRICPSSPFPQEIIDAIIDHLHDEKAALAAFSLASPSFRSPAQKLLYTEITLKPNIQNIKRILHLGRLLRRNPRLRTYIRILVLDLHHDPKFLGRRALRTVLRMLPRLHSLSLVAEQLSWSRNIPKCLKSVLLDLFRSQNLTKLTLSGLWDFPISLLQGDRHINELHLQGVFPPFNNATHNNEGRTHRRRFLCGTSPSLPALVQVHGLYLDFLPFPTRAHEALADVRKSISLSEIRYLHICEMNTTKAIDQCHGLLKQCPEPVEPFDFCMFFNSYS